MSIKENMEEHMSNWDELIKRRAISDLFKVIRDCNNEIEKVTEKYDSILLKMINNPDLYLKHNTERFMQMEATLYLCNQYFQSDKSQTFEEFIGGTIVTETTPVETMAEENFTANIVAKKDSVEFDEGTKLALELIDNYAEALKEKVIESASNNMLDIFKENLDE